jgi:hypothetical protein
MEANRKDPSDFYSNAVRAGKRTYFFDVRAVRDGGLYLTITESKKKSDDGGQPYFEKHKIFLYREDFEKFSNALVEALDYIRDNDPAEKYQSRDNGINSYSDVDFEDLETL